MHNTKTPPLLPPTALEYYIDGSSDNSLYLKATSIRSCLENIVETIFVHIVDNQEKNDWQRKTLFEKIKFIEDFFPQPIRKKLHNIRKTGNKGTHQSLHKELDKEKIDLSLQDLSQICEWTLLAYFKKHGFISHPWIPTVFSTLPPIYRIRILENLLENICIEKHKVIKHLNKIQIYNTLFLIGEISSDKEVIPTDEDKKIEEYLLLIDKLAMAYLKNKERPKAFDFIENKYKLGYINSIFRDEMFEKLDNLWKSIDQLTISKNITESKEHLKKILPAVKKEERSLFITLFTAILTNQ